MLNSAAAQSLADRFFDEFYFPDSPTTATSAGIHKYDDELEDYSKAATRSHLQAEAVRISIRETARRIPTAISSFRYIRAELLDIEESDPGRKTRISIRVASPIAPYRDHEPHLRAARRAPARSDFAGTQDAAGAGDAAINLVNPPKIYTEIALEQIPGLVSFFESDVPLAFKSVTDAKLLADFKVSNASVVSALQAYEKFLREQRLPKSNGDFRLGADQLLEEAPL